ncbi:MAG: glycosyltransferase family 1 protein [Chloroflexota bacterium]
MLLGVDASRAALDRRTGTEAYSLHLIRAMLAQTTHHVRLFFNQHPPKEMFPASTAEHRELPSRRLWTHYRLARELSRNPVDWLFVPSHILPLLFSGKAAVTVHDLGFRHFPEAHRLTDRMYLDLMTRRSISRADVVFADSNATREDLVLDYRVPDSKIVVAYPGYDESLTRTTDDEIARARDKYGLAEDYILYLGTLQPRKNILRLIDAWEMLPIDQQPQLALAGGLGWLASGIKARVSDFNQSQIALLGYIPEEDKAALLSGAIAFAFPSLYEGFGFPVLEAMACGTPVVCSDSSSLPEVANSAALMVDPLDTKAISNSLLQLIENYELRNRLIGEGYRNLQRFSWVNCAAVILNAIEENK